MTCDYNPYTLPTIDFVGGTTQDLVFHLYHFVNKRPFSLYGGSANFSVINFVNKNGAPIIAKSMDISSSEFEDGEVDNVLRVTLLPNDTVNMVGKYIYQITLKDEHNDVEIPDQGIMRITNNIDKSFIR